MNRMHDENESQLGFIVNSISAGLCFLLVHLMMIFRFGPFGDEAWDLTGTCWGIYLAGGRYTVTLFRMLFSDCGVPVAYGLAASVFWGIAVAVQMEILKIEKPAGRFLFVALSVSVVQLSYLMINAFIADAVCLGLLAVSAAYWFYERWNKTRDARLFVCAVLLGVIGLGAYQLLALLLPVLFLSNLLRNRDSGCSLALLLRRFLVFSGWCVAVLGCNVIVVQVGKSFCSASDLAITEGYQASLITLGQLDVFTHVLHMGKQGVMHLLGLAYPGEWVYATVFAALAMILADIWRGGQPRMVKLVYMGGAILIYLLPFLPIVAIGEDRGPRLFLAQPLACATLWYLALMPRLKCLPAWLPGVCGVFFVLKASYVVSDTAFHQKRLFEQSLVHRSVLASRINNVKVPVGVKVESCPVEIYGSIPSSINGEVLYGSCIIDAGSHHLEDYLGTNEWKKLDKHDSELMEEVRKMPVYPTRGSIQYHNGKILVRLKK